ncbi:MAG: acylphosphatase [Ignavibacteriaceae bacterium]|nr:acylphosphatase [Ignavibacteriaceae bacterium]
MINNNARAEIIVNGLVQGVGFRYYVVKQAVRLKLTGFVQNLYTGEVLTIVEGEKILIDELFKLIKLGPANSQVKNAKITWSEFKNEFDSFEVKF